MKTFSFTPYLLKKQLQKWRRQNNTRAKSDYGKRLIFGVLPLILLMIMLLPTREAHGAISHVQKVTEFSQYYGFGPSSIVVPVTANATAGNSVIVTLMWGGWSSGLTASCSDSQGNSYTTDVSEYYSGAGLYSVICSAHNVTALTTSDNITVSFSGATYGVAIIAHEFSGLASSSPLDQTASTNGSSITPSSGNTFMTTQADELLVGAIGVSGPPTDSFTPGSGYTALGSVGFTGAWDGTINPEYQIVSATGAYQADGTLSQSRGWGAAIATYKSVPSATTITISGTLYSGEGTGPLSGQTVRLLVEGASAGTDITDAFGNYSITATVTAGDTYVPLLVYVDDGSVDGTTVTVLDSTISTTISTLDLYADHLITRQDEGGTPLDTGDMDNAKNLYTDADILYSISWPNTTVTGTNTELYVASGHFYTPQGNVTTPHMQIQGTLNAGSNTFNVSGDWDFTNGTFNFDTSNVNFTGSGTIKNDVSNWWNKRFYNLTASASGQTTTILSGRGTVVHNVLTLGTGILSGGEMVLNKGSGTAFITAGATLSNSIFKYSPNGTEANITPTHYPDLWLAENHPNTNFSLSGDIQCNRLQILGNGSGKISRLDTAGHAITCNHLQVGNTSNRYGQLNLNNSVVTIHQNLTTHDTPTDINELNADNATLYIGGNWENNDTFNASTSHVIFNGTTNQNIQSSGDPFYNLTLENTGGSSQNSLILQDPLALSNNLTITTGKLNTTLSNHSISVSGDFDQSSANGEVEANASVITVNGNFIANGSLDSTNYNTASLILTGTGSLDYQALSQHWLNGVNNLTTGQLGHTTTSNSVFSVRNVLTVGSGRLTGASDILLHGTNPLTFDPNTTLSIQRIRFFGSNQTIPPLPNGYDCDIKLSRHNTTVNQTGPITLNTGKGLRLNGDNFANRAVTYKTNGFDLNIGGHLEIGSSGNTALKRLDIRNSNVTIAGNIEIISGTTAFTSNNSTVTLNGTGAQSIRMNGKNFDRLILTNTSTSGVTFNDGFTANQLTNTTANGKMTFAAGQNYTINNAVTLQGASGQLLTLASSSPGTHWNFIINAGASKNINHVNVSWSDASGSHTSQKSIDPNNSNDGGNNIDWFPASELTVTKSSTLISDPVNNTGAEKNHIPGAIVEYSVTVRNLGDASPDSNTVVIYDVLDANLEYDVTTGVLFSDGSTSSALTLNTVSYSHTNTPTLYTYTPTGTFDPNVAGIKIETNGSFAFGGSPAPEFIVTYQVRIK